MVPDTKSTDPRTAIKVLALVANLGLVGLGGLLYPLFHNAAIFAVGVPLLAINCVLILAARRGEPWASRLTGLVDALARVPRLQGVSLMALSLIVFGGGTEMTIRLLTDAGLLGYRAPMLTQLPGGVEDWRMAHITADTSREPDPVLFWRPNDREPYNSHHMRGPEPVVPKPSGTFRIITYGDSNTDGPPEGGWPRDLRRRLDEVEGGAVIELLNAGVTGYSSHQGLLRFRQQVERYQPDLVLVAFGWNDAAPAVGRPDSEFDPPHWAIVAVQRTLVKYRSYLSAQHYLEGLRPEIDEASLDDRRRVSVAEYVANLHGFLDVAAQHGVEVVLLTRVHSRTPRDLRTREGWRSTVPDYNGALRQLATEQEASWLDAQRLFEPRPELFVDAAHLTAEGHGLLADELMMFLERQDLLPRRVRPGGDQRSRTKTAPSIGSPRSRSR